MSERPARPRPGPRNLTSDPAVEHLADPRTSDAELRGSDARSGGDPHRAPRSLHATELRADDEAIAADEWDEPDSL